MYMNMKAMGVDASAGGFVSVYLQSDAEYDTAVRRERSTNPRRIVMTIAEAHHAVRCLYGWATFYPYFDDGIHLLKLTPGGAKVIDLDGGVRRQVYGTDEYEQGTFAHQHYYSFPGREFAYLVEMATRQAERFKSDVDVAKAKANDPNTPYWQRPSVPYETTNRRWAHHVQPGTLAHWRKQYAPKVKVEWRQDEFCDALAGYEAALTDPRVVTKDHLGLEALLQNLVRIAENRSDGEVVTVHISRDNTSDVPPMSFYWWIELPDGRQYMNGGLVAHPNRAKDQAQADDLGLEWPEGADEDYHKRPVDSYEYSSHT